MATLNTGSQGKGNRGGQHDGQKNYQNSNQRNPDNVRNDTRDHQYKDFDEALTNDANFQGGAPLHGAPDYDDTQQNVDKHKNPEE